MAHNGVIYLDHSATSWPKPPEVVAAVVDALERAGGNPHRSAHTLALAASRVILEARSSVASLLGVADSRDVAFVPGCTYGLNLALRGLLRHGDRVVVSSVEHNAVARPLARLAVAGVKVVTVKADSTGLVDADELEAAVMRGATKAVVCQHASNVTGAIQPVGDFADIAHAAGAVLVVDGAQAAGHVKVDLAALGADVYVASGHKGLLGPQGVGVLYIAPGLEVRELVQGGSGGHSAGNSMPTERPDRYEAGTPNTPAIAGLGAAASLLAPSLDTLITEEHRLTRRLMDGLAQIPGLRTLGPAIGVERVPVVSVAHESAEADRIAFELDSRYRIAVRAGLHCAPQAHETVGTLECGAVRFGIGRGVTEDDIDTAIAAMAEVCG
ncbi:MAG: aminotransferase class V-fold PLP-dependent enzyme [Coriobacteriia bacterium]